MSNDADNKPKEERRPLTREEREAMKRELKRQMRAYVDALKAQILGAKEKGEKPDLEEALSKAAEEAEKKLIEEAAQGDPMVKQAAAFQAAARQAAAPARPRHDGLIPRLSAWTPPAAEEETASVRKDVLEVATGSERDTGQDGHKPAATGAAITVNPVAGERQEKNERQEYLVPDEEAAKSAIPREELERLTRDIIAALKTIYDPEIPVDIYELGLIYRIDIADDRTVTIDMTLTAPGCPVAGEMPGWVQKAVGEVEGVKEVKVNLVFDPPWDMSRMSDEARLALNMF